MAAFHPFEGPWEGGALFFHSFQIMDFWPEWKMESWVKGNSHFSIPLRSWLFEWNGKV